jgi:hypothetical protein
MEVLDKLTDLERSLVISQSDGIDGQPGELFDQGYERLKIFLDRDMESVSVFEIDGYCKSLIAFL